MISKQEINILINKYKREDLSYKEIKIRLEQLKFELNLNHINSKEKKDINKFFKEKFRELN